MTTGRPSGSAEGAAWECSFGHVAQPGGKRALVELEFVALLLPSDEVVLLLAPVQGMNLAQYRPTYGPGVLVVKNGQFSGESARRYGLDQRSFAAVWKTLADGGLAPGHFHCRQPENS